MAQYSGVLCHITSLPSGDLGDAKKFIDTIAEAGVSIWQMLPITPPDEHGSPYASPSAFAADPALGQGPIAEMDDEEYWLNDWLLFQKIKEEQGGKPWTEWPIELRDRDHEALSSIEIDSSNQAAFMGAWKEVQTYAKGRGISLMGDLPIFVAHDSADVWAHRELFQLDGNGMPNVVAGVPPDYFSKDGQKWGTVLYEWDAHEAEGWQWWRMRMARMLRLFDMVRIDHFRGFHSAWAIPSGAKNARKGKWQDGPKDALVKVLVEVAGNHECIIAEDLGIIPSEVTELRKRHNLKGMSVLQFGFDDNNSDNPHRPANITRDRIVYTGTHDNDTTASWWDSSPKSRIKRIKPHIRVGESICQTMIRLGLSSDASMVIVPLQDIMELGNEARMNTPGIAHGNWKWRFEWQDLQPFSLVSEGSKS